MADTMIRPEEPDNIGYVSPLSSKRRHPLYYTRLVGRINLRGQYLEQISVHGGDSINCNPPTTSQPARCPGRASLKMK